MRVSALWRLGQALLLIGMVAGMAAGLAGGPSAATAPVAIASVAADNDNDDNDDDPNVLRGQVVSPAPGTLPAIDRSASPPVMFIANIDGIVTVLVLDPSQLDTSGVQRGDHVRLDGQKISELLFEATDIEVTQRCCPSPRRGNADNDNGDGNADDDGNDNGNADNADNDAGDNDAGDNADSDAGDNAD